MLCRIELRNRRTTYAWKLLGPRSFYGEGNEVELFDSCSLRGAGGSSLMGVSQITRTPSAMSRSIPVYRLQLNRSAAVPGLPRTCETARDAYEAFKAHLGDPDREHLLAIYLDWRRRVLGLHVAAIGNRNLLHSEAREVFSAGLLLHASDVVLVHNHPSGDATPSEEDEFRTRELEIAGLLLGITVLDHIVVGERDYRSIRTTGHMLMPMEGTNGLTLEEIEERTQRVLDLHLRRARALRTRAKRRKTKGV